MVEKRPSTIVAAGCIVMDDGLWSMVYGQSPIHPIFNKKNMDSRQQLTLIDKILRELEDLKKSQATVLKKISQIEAENINLGSEILNEALPGIHEGMDDAVQKLTALLDQFKEYRTEFERDHPASQGEAG